MGPQLSILAQSRFYSPAFNAAIFDGPFRIYFAQYQEPFALKIYFSAQQRLKDLYQNLRERLKSAGVNIFVMLYPSPESFQLSFPGDGADSVVIDRLAGDYVIGIRGPLDEVHIENLNQRMTEIASAVMNEVPRPAISSEAVSR